MQDQSKLRKEVAIRLKQARKKAGYSSPKDFCQKNHLDLGSYLAHEKGEISLKSVAALRYCKLLGISLPWLLVGN